MLKQDWGTRSVRPGTEKIPFPSTSKNSEIQIAIFGKMVRAHNLRRVYKAARVTQAGVLPYLRARVTLAGGLSFSLVNTPGRVNPPTRA